MNPAVTLICLSDRPAHLAVLLSALAVQTRRDWECIVLNQGAALDLAAIPMLTDGRVAQLAIPRHGDWGQTEKFKAVEHARGTWVGFPNDDAYYCPRYLELMVEAAERAGAELVYCDWVSAADAGEPYVPYMGVPAIGHIDVGGFLVRRDRVQAHGWDDRGPTGDGALISSLARQGVPHVRVPATLYVKN